jgi:3-oxoadipate enol-lactonase
VKLHWEDTGGAGPPVLLIMGLGMNATSWWRTVPVLTDAGLRVIAFDNRGVGRSERTTGPYTVAQMADDAVSVLDDAGVERAQVYAISLGGMIAQEVAVRHPDRVMALVLGATTAGGAAHVPADDATVAFLSLRAQMTAEHAVWASVPINYASRTRTEGGDRIAEDIAQRLRFPVEAEYYTAQLAAANGHDARVEDIADIPGAELFMWPGAAHLYFTDEPEVDRHVAAWLSRH